MVAVVCLRLVLIYFSIVVMSSPVLCFACLNMFRFISLGIIRLLQNFYCCCLLSVETEWKMCTVLPDTAVFCTCMYVIYIYIYNPPPFLKIVVDVKALGPPYILKLWLQ